MKQKDIYDWSTFTSADGASDLLGNAIRKSLESNYLPGPPWRARALQDFHTLTAKEMAALNLSASETANGTYYGFRARILGVLSPDVFAEDPSSWDPTEEYAARVIELHTMYLAADQEEGASVTRGDVVLVDTEEGETCGTFLSLQSVEMPPTEGPSMPGLAGPLQQLNYSGGTTIDGKMLYTPDVPQAGLADKVSRRTKVKCTKPSTGDFSKYFSSINSEKPGSQLGEFGTNNWRLDQPTLGNIKWFVEKKVKTFYRLNHDGGATINKKGKIAANDLSHSYDNQTGLCIGSELEAAYAASLGAKMIKLDAGRAGNVKKTYVEDAVKNGNTMIHCTHGADRTGYAVALVLQRIGGKLPPLKGKDPPDSAGESSDPEDLYAYTISFNSWDKSAICGSHNCKNLGYMRYLSYFYDPKDFCARKDRINKCPGCKCAGNVTKYGISSTHVSAPAPKTEKEKCEETVGWTWYDDGTKAGTGCWEDA